MYSVGSNWDSRACVNPLSLTFLRTDPLLFQSSVFFCFISYIYCVQEGFNILFYLCSLHYYFNSQQYMLLGGLFFRECAISDPFNVCTQLSRYDSIVWLPDSWTILVLVFLPFHTFEPVKKFISVNNKCVNVHINISFCVWSNSFAQNECPSPRVTITNVGQVSY